MVSIAWVWPALDHSANKGNVEYGHPAHHGFQEVIGAEPIVYPNMPVGPLSGTFIQPILAAQKLSIPEFDVFILSNLRSAYAIPFIRYKYPNAILIQLAADLEFFGSQSYVFSKDILGKSVVRRIERRCHTRITRWLIRRYVDGVITVSKLMKKTVSGFAPDLPVEIAHPYIQPSMVTALSNNDPSLDTNRALTVCEAREHKGVDMLVSAWPAVREQVPNARLHVVGKDHPNQYGDVTGVVVKGYVDDLVSEMSTVSLYVQPARADAFPVTVLEAMYGGLVPLVTQTTGNKSVVKSISENLVVEPNIDSIAEGIVNYFKTAKTTRKEYSSRAENLAQPYVAERKQDEFKEVFESLVNDICNDRKLNQ